MAGGFKRWEDRVSGRPGAEERIAAAKEELLRRQDEWVEEYVVTVRSEQGMWWATVDGFTGFIAAADTVPEVLQLVAVMIGESGS